MPEHAFACKSGPAWFRLVQKYPRTDLFSFLIELNSVELRTFSSFFGEFFGEFFGAKTLVILEHENQEKRYLNLSKINLHLQRLVDQGYNEKNDFNSMLSFDFSKHLGEQEAQIRSLIFGDIFWKLFWYHIEKTKIGIISVLFCNSTCFGMEYCSNILVLLPTVKPDRRYSDFR